MLSREFLLVDDSSSQGSELQVANLTNSLSITLCQVFIFILVLAVFLRTTIDAQQKIVRIALLLILERYLFFAYGIAYEVNVYRNILIFLAAAVVAFPANSSKLHFRLRALVLWLPLGALVVAIIFPATSVESLPKATSDSAALESFVVSTHLDQTEFSRTLSGDDLLRANRLAGRGVPDLASLAPVQSDVAAGYIMEVLQEPADETRTERWSYVVPVGWPGMAREPSPSPTWEDYLGRLWAYDLVGVRYLIASLRDVDLLSNTPGFNLIASLDERVFIFERKTALPLAWLPNAVQESGDRDQDVAVVSSLVGSGQWPGIVDQTAPLLKTRAAQLGLRTSLEGSFLKVSLDEPAAQDELVFMSLAYDPWMKASAGGDSRPVFPANLNLIAVQIEEGDSDIQISYRPPSTEWLVLMAGLALAVIVSVLGLIMDLNGRRRIIQSRLKIDSEEPPVVSE